MPDLLGAPFYVGLWRVCPASGEIRRGDETIRLQPLTLKLLVYMASRQGQAVTRDQLIEHVWGGTIVGDDAISAAILKLRRALSPENPNSRDYIETLPKIGYRLVQTVTASNSVILANEPHTNTDSGGHFLNLPWFVWLVLFFLSAAFIVMFLLIKNQDPAPSVRQDHKIITNLPGAEVHQSLSPDGRRLAFSYVRWTEAGSLEDADIYIVDVATGNPLPLVKNPGFDFSPVWSPDGVEIIFLRMSRDWQQCDIFKKMVSDNTDPTHLATCGPTFVDSAGAQLDWSQDGEWVAYTESNTEPTKTRNLVIRSLRTGEITRIMASSQNFFYLNPSFSPDSKYLAYSRHSDNLLGTIFIADIQTGIGSRITFDETNITGIDWSPDGSKLLIGYEKSGEATIVQYDLQTSGIKSKTLVTEAANPRTSAGRPNHLYYQQIVERSDWKKVSAVADTSKIIDINEATEINFNSNYVASLSHSPIFGQMVAVVENAGEYNIWLLDGLSRVSKNLTPNQRISKRTSLSWSPSGNQIVFNINLEPSRGIYLLDVENASASPLISGLGVYYDPIFSPDEKTVYYSAPRDGLWQIRKLHIESKEDELVTSKGGIVPQIDEKGEWIYYYRSPFTASWGIWRVSPNGFGTELIYDGPSLPFPYNWQILGGFLYYALPDGENGTNIFRMTIETKETSLWLSVPGQSIRSFFFSRDGKTLYLHPPERIESDIAVMEYKP